MFDSVNPDSTVPVYVQIENLVQFAIASGEIKGGERLPSVGDMAQRLGINVNTVNKAYRDLAVMGLLQPRRGMGVFVNKGVEAKCREQCRRKAIARLHEVVAEAKATGMKDRDIKAVASKSFASDVGPYGQVPAALLSMAKSK